MAWTDATQAVAAAVGAIATPAAVVLGMRSLRLQQQQHDEQVRRLELKQPAAATVHATVREWPTVDGLNTYVTVVAAVANHGADAVYDLVLHWRHKLRERETAVDYKEILLPSETWECPAPTYLAHLGPHEQISTFVTFSDGDSRAWAKTQRGRLTRLRDAVDEGW